MTNEELVIEIKAGDKDKLLELWEQNQKFVNSKANAWKRAFPRIGFVDKEDLVQAAWLAMVDAVEYFNPGAENATFLTAFSWFMKRYFYREFCIHYTRKEAIPPFILSLDEPITANDPEGSTYGDTVTDESAGAAFEKVDTQCELENIRAVLEEVAADNLSPNAKMIFDRFMRGEKHITGNGFLQETGKTRGRLWQYKEQMLEALRTDTRIMQLWLDFTAQDVSVEEIASRSIQGVGIRSFESRNASTVELAVIDMIRREKNKKRSADALGAAICEAAWKEQARRMSSEYETARQNRLRGNETAT